MISVNVIHGVGTNAFDALLYPEQSINHLQYFQNQVTNFSSTLNDVGRQFMASARDVYDRINSSEAMNLARAAVRAAKGVFHANTIIPMYCIEDFQAAQPVMQRWIMACPSVREVYHEQRCSGYDGTYVDLFPGLIREQHYDYRRVMDGVIDEDGDEWVARFFPDDLFEGDRELLHDEKCNILRNWEMADLFMKAGKGDPTSQSGGKL